MARPRTWLSIAIVLLSLIVASQACAQGIQITPNPFTFPDLQPVGSPLPGILQVVITNTGTQPLIISSATLTGDFSFGSVPPSQSVNFGTVLTVAAFVLRFDATAAGPRTGTLTLVDNAPGSPHTFAISGTGFVGAMIQSQPSKLVLDSPIFGPIQATVDIVNVGTDPVTISSISASGNGFSQTNNCSAFTTQGQKCQLTMVYNPTAPGPQTGTITVANTGAINPVTIEFLADAGDFDFLPNPAQSTATVIAGQKANFPFVVTGIGNAGAGIDTIAFSCTGLPLGATCVAAADPTSTPPPGFAVPAILTISTTARTLGSLHPNSHGWGWSLAVMAALALILRRRRRLTAFLTMLIAATLLAVVVSCGAPSAKSIVNPNGTPAGTYNITLSGTRNGLTHTFSVTMNVR